MIGEGVTGGSWPAVRQRLAADAERLRRFQESKFGYRLRAWFVDPAWWAVLLHRLSALAWARGHRKTARLLMQVNSLATGADIHPAADLGGGLLIPTPCGVTLSCKAGRDLTVMALAGIGGSLDGEDIGAGPGLPVLGDGVVIGPFAGLQKAIRIGDHAVVEGGSGALKDLPAYGRVGLASTPLLAAAVPDPPPPHAVLPPCPHGTWARTRADIAADIDRYLAELGRYQSETPGRWVRLSGLLTNPGLATAVHRIAHWQHASGRPRLARALTGLNRLLHRVTITSDSCIGGGLFVPHLGGTLFCGTAGRNLTLYANALCAPHGPARDGGRALAPILGDDVMVGGHASVIGAVTVGSAVRVATKLQAVAAIPGDADAFTPMGRFAERQGGGAPTATMDAREKPPDAPRPRWREARAALRVDLARLRASGQTHFAATACVRLHRLAEALHARGWRRGARWAWLANQLLTGADISPASRLGPGLMLPHPAGLFVHASAGGNLTMLAQCCIGPLVDGQGRLPPLSQAPRLGAGVSLSHHAGIYGCPDVGNAVYIGPGCVVSESVADGAILVPRPMKLRRRQVAPGGDVHAPPTGSAGPAGARLDAAPVSDPDLRQPPEPPAAG